MIIMIPVGGGPGADVGIPVHGEESRVDGQVEHHRVRVRRVGLFRAEPLPTDTLVLVEVKLLNYGAARNDSI